MTSTFKDGAKGRRKTQMNVLQLTSGTARKAYCLFIKKIHLDYYLLLNSYAPDISMGWCPFCKRRSKWWNMENMDAAIVQNETTGMFLRFPMRTGQNKKVSATMVVTGSSNPSRSRSNGPSIFVNTASMNPGMSSARTRSDGITLGIVPNRMRGGLLSEPMKPSHSSVTTKVISMSSRLETSSSQKFIMGLTWPLPGNGTATTWHDLDRSVSSESIPTPKRKGVGG